MVYDRFGSAKLSYMFPISLTDWLGLKVKFSKTNAIDKNTDFAEYLLSTLSDISCIGLFFLIPWRLKIITWAFHPRSAS